MFLAQRLQHGFGVSDEPVLHFPHIAATVAPAEALAAIAKVIPLVLGPKKEGRERTELPPTKYTLRLTVLV